MIDKTRAGILKKNLHGDMAYKSFCPSDLPPTPPIEINDKILDLLIDAHKTLAILDDRGKNIPDMNLFVSIYVQKKLCFLLKLKGHRRLWKIYLIRVTNQI